MPDSTQPSLGQKLGQKLGLLHGLRSVPRAVRILRELPGVLRLLLIPLALTAVLDVLAFRYGYAWLVARIASLVPDNGAWHSVRSVLGWLAGALVIVLLAWTFSFVYLLFCELVVDSVSEAVEAHVLGRHSSAEAISSRLHGMWLSLVQAILLWGLGISSLLLGLIPVIGPVLTLLCSITVLGYGFFAISAGRKAQTLSERWQLANSQLRAVMGLGSWAFIINLVPIVNLLALPVFVVAGTLLYLDTTATPEPKQS